VQPDLVRVTVLIAPADAIPALRQQPFLQESVSFTDAEADLALEEIRRSIPAIIALERSFASSPAGRNLLRAIRQNDALATCQIQTVGVRRSHRYRVNERVLLDGESATLLDISVTGAHVVCPAALKPTQQVNLALRLDSPPLAAETVWVQYELPKEGPRYRAGIRFADSAAASVAEYISEMAR
jgi:hypothetical protein